MKHYKTTAAILLTALFGASAAHAAAELIIGYTITGISGFSGTSTIGIGAPSSEHAVSFLSAGERNNRPCELKVYKADVNGATNSLFAEWDVCTSTSPNKTIGWPTGDGIYVRGIRACTNNSSNHRLKGIQIFGATISSTGVVTPVGDMDWFTRPNCETWHPPVFCTAGRVATKVRVHLNGDEITGLSLGCRRATEQ